MTRSEGDVLPDVKLTWSNNSNTHSKSLAWRLCGARSFQGMHNVARALKEAWTSLDEGGHRPTSYSEGDIIIPIPAVVAHLTELGGLQSKLFRQLAEYACTVQTNGG